MQENQSGHEQATPKQDQEPQRELGIVLYEDSESGLTLELPIDATAETIWATQEQIAALFGKDNTTISRHIGNIYKEGELDESATLAKFARVQEEGSRSISRNIPHYNLDMIISVGYRVSSQKATKFRQAATKILKTYITEGYVLNEARLEQDPQALSSLAQTLRQLRLNEKNVYKQVTDCFKESAIDYDPNSQAWRTFYSKLQDKFYFAATEQTSPEIKMSRASHKKDNMGLVVVEGKKGPTKKEVQVAKAYLSEQEFRTLHIIADLFLTYAESKAIRNQSLTMDQLMEKFDSLLEVTEYPLLKEYPARHFFKVKQAEVSVENERQLYLARMKTLES